MISRSAHRLEVGEQTVVSVSTQESEEVALSKACLMVVYLRHLPKTISSEQTAVTVVFEDNLGAVYTSQSNKVTPRTKHINIKFHHVRSLIADKVVDVKYIKTGSKRPTFSRRAWAHSSVFQAASCRLKLLGE